MVTVSVGANGVIFRSIAAVVVRRFVRNTCESAGRSSLRGASRSVKSSRQHENGGECHHKCGDQTVSDR